MINVTASKIKANLGKYLDLVLSGKEINIVRYGRVIAKLIPQEEIIYIKEDKNELE